MLDFGQHAQLGFADPAGLVGRTFREIRLPERVRHEDYERHPVPPEMHVPPAY